MALNERNMSTLVTGGSGRLGHELKQYLQGSYPTKDEFDILQPPWQHPEPKLVVHMAGYTDVDRAENDVLACFNLNIKGTYNLLEQYGDRPFVFISTEHVNAPGVYFQSKLIGEMLVRNMAKSHLIIRTIFKPNPWPFEYAFTDQMTQGDYVDVIAPLIATTIEEWDEEPKTIYVGTGRKSMFDLAKRTKEDVKPNSIKDMAISRPADYI